MDGFANGRNQELTHSSFSGKQNKSRNAQTIYSSPDYYAFFG